MNRLNTSSTGTREKYLSFWDCFFFVSFLHEASIYLKDLDLTNMYFNYDFRTPTAPVYYDSRF